MVHLTQTGRVSRLVAVVSPFIGIDVLFFVHVVRTVVDGVFLTATFCCAAGRFALPNLSIFFLLHLHDPPNFRDNPPIHRQPSDTTDVVFAETTDCDLLFN